MQLSSDAIAAMGFTRIPVDGAVSAAFHALHVFSVQGITVSADQVVVKQGRAAGLDYTIGCGASVNAVCKTLLGQQFTENETEWARARGANAPYLVVHLGPTALHTASQGYIKNEAGDIISYDTFAQAREELNQLEARALPSIEMALSVIFAGVTPPVRLLPSDVARFGLTPDGVTVHDVRITGGAEGYVSTSLDATQLEAHLTSAAKLSARVNKRAAAFFRLGRRDEDELKRFLYFFLAIEIETHRVFRTVSRRDHLRNVASYEARIGDAAERLLEQKADNWVNLADLFVWCVASVWKHLDLEDVREFQRLKKIRDNIAHGNVAAPPTGSAAAAEALAMKIHPTITTGA
jgi:hypothetical protein